MSKNLIVILYFGLALGAIIMAGLIAILAPEQFERIYQGLLQILGLASTAAITIYLLGTQAKTLEEVKSNTNGTLSTLAAENQDLRNQLLSVVGSAPNWTPPNAKVQPPV